MALRLYTYWRSSAAFRVRIALALKGLDYESIPRHLLRDGGEHRRADYLALNPQGLVPALEHDGTVITQSLAICEYLEEVFPRPALLPSDPADRAAVRAMALAVACDVHPLNNLGVLQYLRGEIGATDEAVARGPALDRPRLHAPSSSWSRAIDRRPPLLRRIASRLPTCSSCRRCTTRAASSSTSRPIRGWRRSRSTSNRCRPSSRPPRIPTRCRMRSPPHGHGCRTDQG